MLNYAHYIGYVLLGFGVLWLVIGVRNLLTASASRAWEHTNGKIVKSSVRRAQDGVDDNSPDFYPEIEYEYHVLAESYTGSERYAGSFNERYSTALAAERVLQSYPLGGSVVVYYNPNHPASAVLIPGKNKQGIKEIIRGLLFMAAGAAGVLYHFFTVPK